MVRLLDYQFQRMTQRVPTRVEDGEGGWYVTWNDGAEFYGTISKARSAFIDEAEHDVLHASADLTTTRHAPRLALGDVIRDNNGLTWRVVYVPDEQLMLTANNLNRYGIKRWDEESND